MSKLVKETIPVNIEDEMRQSYLDYAMSVIVGRALPDVPRRGASCPHRESGFRSDRSEGGRNGATGGIATERIRLQSPVRNGGWRAGRRGDGAADAILRRAARSIGGGKTGLILTDGEVPKWS